MERLLKRLDREHLARLSAEAIGETATRELFEKQHQLRLLGSIADASNAATESMTVLEFTLAQVCAYTRLPLGHVYLRLEESPEELHPTALWYCMDKARFKPFQTLTEGTRMPRGVGLPGRVLESGKPEWIIDVTKDPNFPRARVAEEVGLRSAFAFPVMAGNELVAVIELFDVKSEPPNQTLLELMRNIGVQVGRVIERERASRSLARGERLGAIGQLAASVAHELRNPLGAISNAWFYIGRKLQTTEMYVEDKRLPTLGRIIDRELERCSRIISELLNFSGDRTIERTWWPVRMLVEDALTAIGERRSKAKWVTEIPESLEIEVDGDEFRRLLLNLFQNALDATNSSNAEVRTSAVESGDRVTITVTDNGVGMPPGILSKVFDPLFSTKTTGTGLGLAIVKKIVNAHGGEIAAESQPGAGATFTITLPRRAGTH